MKTNYGKICDLLMIAAGFNYSAFAFSIFPGWNVKYVRLDLLPILLVVFVTPTIAIVSAFAARIMGFNCDWISLSIFTLIVVMTAFIQFWMFGQAIASV